MKQIAFLLVGLFPLVACGQGEIEPTESDLRTQVSQIASLVVQNTDSIDELRNQVAGIAAKANSNESLIQELLQRVTDLENGSAPPITVPAPVVEYVIPRVIEYVAPTPVPVPPTQPTVTKTRTVTRPQSGGRTFRTPVRSMFQRLFGMRSRRMTTQVNQSSGSGNWSWPGDLANHLMSSPHYLPANYVYSLTHSQQVSLHNQLHGG